MVAVGLILRAGTEPIPCGPGEPARRCRYEVVNVWRCLTVVAEDMYRYIPLVGTGTKERGVIKVRKRGHRNSNRADGVVVEGVRALGRICRKS